MTSLIIPYSILMVVEGAFILLPSRTVEQLRYLQNMFVRESKYDIPRQSSIKGT